MTCSPVYATISLEDVSRRQWDAIVIGAGPAGSVAALVLARLGRRVLLVDRAAFPREKACGCCLSLAAVQALGQLGLSRVLEQHHAESIGALDLRVAGRRLEVPLKGGRMISRRAFDAALISEAIGSGVAFLPQCIAGVGEADVLSRAVQISTGDLPFDARARLVVAAGGLGFPIDGRGQKVQRRERRWIRSRIGGAAIIDGDEVELPRGTVRMMVARRGYVGLARLEDGRFAVGGAFDAALVAECGGLGRAAAQVLEETGEAVPKDVEPAHWLGVPHLTRRPHHVTAERVLAVGDAAGFVEPFTGEGMTWAIQSAASAATLADSFLQEHGAAWDGVVEREWGRLHRSLVRSRQMRCRVIAGVLRHPMLLQACMMAGGLVPRLSRAVVDHIHAPGAAIRILASVPLDRAGGQA